MRSVVLLLMALMWAVPANAQNYLPAARTSAPHVVIDTLDTTAVRQEVVQLFHRHDFTLQSDQPGRLVFTRTAFGPPFRRYAGQGAVPGTHSDYLAEADSADIRTLQVIVTIHQLSDEVVLTALPMESMIDFNRQSWENWRRVQRDVILDQELIDAPYAHEVQQALEVVRGRLEHPAIPLTYR